MRSFRFEIKDAYGAILYVVEVGALDLEHAKAEFAAHIQEYQDLPKDGDTDE